METTYIVQYQDSRYKNWKETKHLVKNQLVIAAFETWFEATAFMNKFQEVQQNSKLRIVRRTEEIVEGVGVDGNC